MPSDAGDPLRDAPSLAAALDEALVGLSGADRPDPDAPVDERWLAVGLRLGLERSDAARRLLDLIEAREADLTTPGAPEAEAPTDDRGGPDATSVPVRSALLARSAAVPFTERGNLKPEAAFGWASSLTRGEVLRLGGVVQEMLASGASADIGRGFGLAWDAGARLPRKELDQLFREFTELELTIASVLAGRDLRSEPALRPDRSGGLLAQLLPRSRPGEAQATAALESSGDPGRFGLVATWNAWMAMRYRSLIPPRTVELLIRPWVTVVGPLPAPMLPT